MMSRMESSNEIKSELTESTSPADKEGAVIVLLALGLSIALGFMVGFVTQQSLTGVVCGLAVFAAAVLGGERYAVRIAEKLHRKEAKVSIRRPEQQSNPRGDAATSIEPQTARGGVGVQRAPKRPDKALLEYEGTTTLQPEEPEACYGKGIALFDLRRFDEALHSFDEAIRLKPNNQEAWYMKRLCLLELERSDKAVVAFRKARTPRPNMTKRPSSVA